MCLFLDFLSKKPIFKSLEIHQKHFPHQIQKIKIWDSQWRGGELSNAERREGLCNLVALHDLARGIARSSSSVGSTTMWAATQLAGSAASKQALSSSAASAAAAPPPELRCIWRRTRTTYVRKRARRRWWWWPWYNKRSVCVERALYFIYRVALGKPFFCSAAAALLPTKCGSYAPHRLCRHRFDLPARLDRPRQKACCRRPIRAASSARYSSSGDHC